MGKPSEKKRKRHQHTVPRFYLRRFAEGERLFRVPIDGGDPRLVGVGDAAVHKDFYSFRGADGQLDDFVEDALSEMEDDAARVLRMVVDERCWPLPDDAREVMAYWVAAQHLRVPARRQAGNEIADHLLKVVAATGGKPAWRQRMEEAAGGPVADEDADHAWAQVSDFSSYTIEASTAEHLRVMGEMLPLVADLLMQRTWVLARFQHKTLITSDHPVVQIWDPATPKWLGQGLATVPAVCMALDRRVALMMLLPGGPRDRLTPPTGAMARDLNQRTASSARAAVFHHPDDGLTGIELPPPRGREIQVNGSPERFLMPDGPSDVFKRVMSDIPMPPPSAKPPRFESS
ncbi:DUF4238 domain-containing protein [Streptomyces sp. NPDC090106]|uniref:DUF4238 domain-containing protein n=1 Tax=Streptomyces sp. NPDC090106 TaxID=3365946 RepID=UPI00380CF39B